MCLVDKTKVISSKLVRGCQIANLVKIKCKQTNRRQPRARCFIDNVVNLFVIQEAL